MSFYDVLQSVDMAAVAQALEAATEADVLRALASERPTRADFLALLSPVGARQLEAMARRAHDLTVQHFGRAIHLFTPLYLANHCVNRCVYCGFNTHHDIHRRQLTLEEVEAEARCIAATGLKHILLLTGEAPKTSSVEYMAQCAQVLARYFASLSVEVYPLDRGGYAKLLEAGIDGMTMFQEAYDEAAYLPLHPGGPKRDYRFRLEAPDRACAAGFRQVGVGALLGLHDWRLEAFSTGLHADYLQSTYPSVEVSVSVPRIRPQTGGFQPKVEVADRDLVQYIAALRIFMPRAGVTLSSRERAGLRDNLLRLGVTRMSAGVSTSVGGRATGQNDPGQFEISDERSVAEMAAMFQAQGYQPVYKDW